MPRRSFVVCLCALVIGACVPPQDEDKFVRYKSDTTMGKIQDRGEIVAGLDPSMPPFSDTSDSFVLEFARFIADELRVDLEVVELDTDTALEAMKEGEIDLAFPLIPITERLARQNAFTAPYYVGHQRLLVEAGGDITGLEDLAGKSLCEGPPSDAGSALNVDLSELVADISLAGGPGACDEPLREGTIDAVTGPDPYLISLASRIDGTRIVGEELSTYGYGAVVRDGASDMQGFVSAAVTEAKTEGRWLEFFDEHIAQYAEATDPTAPDLTLEEAATLYPRELE